MNESCEKSFGQGASQVDVLSSVRSFVTRVLGRTIQNSENFFETGMVSSLFGMQVIAFLEDAFSVTVNDEDLVLTNFNSIQNISLFVERKRASS